MFGDTKVGGKKLLLVFTSYSIFPMSGDYSYCLRVS